ncbi:putative fructokinase-6, chloroplastic [Senna tora]|uniref:Putative fructokinase-6, chloroplastic n=1 Tax=Senna tora TaxID=362788 RepID=A0A834WAS6_9FABA|nr:putative fructokinase-6, chloroplastic [Senna tora]
MHILEMDHLKQRNQKLWFVLGKCSNGLSFAEAPAFQKPPRGAPANFAVGIACLVGSAAFIGKVFVHRAYKLNLKSSVIVTGLKEEGVDTTGAKMLL